MHSGPAKRDPVRIVAARTQTDMASVTHLMQDYARQLPRALALEAACEPLPGQYAPPAGELLLARRGRSTIGCIAMRAFRASESCEFKRLFVEPRSRGCAIGKRLVRTLERVAAMRGYRLILLDTFEDMTAARALYVACGFEVIPPYRPVRFPGLVYMRKTLDQPGADPSRILSILG